MSVLPLLHTPPERCQHLDNHFLIAFVVGSAVIYLSLVCLLRFRALRNLEQKYSRYARSPYSMDYKTAREIMKPPMLYECHFPTVSVPGGRSYKHSLSRLIHNLPDSSISSMLQ